MPVDVKTIQKPLTQRLKSTLQPTEIKELAKIVALLGDGGIKVDDVFPYGIPSQNDAISIRGNITPQQLAKIGTLVAQIETIKDFKIFPRGIVAPDSYRVHVNLNR